MTQTQNSYLKRRILKKHDVFDEQLKSILMPEANIHVIED